MKFNNGYWLMREGVTPSFPQEVYDCETADNTLKLYLTDHVVYNRGMTLGGALYNTEITSPTEGVFRIRMTYHKGSPTLTPFIDVADTIQPSDIDINDEDIAMQTKGISLKIKRRNALEFSFYSGDTYLTGFGARNFGAFDTPEGRYSAVWMHLGVGENVYGMGERFSAFIKNGQIVTEWNEDGGTGSEQAYKNIPFYMTNKGYGVYVNSPNKVEFEVASEKVSRVQFSVPESELDFYIIAGDPKTVLDRYTTLTGKPSLPPAWSFGLWLTTSFTTSYDEQTVTSFIDGMAERDIPLSVFHFDCFWMKEYHWCDFLWDERVFPDPSAMLKRLKAKGLRICLWINPYISERSYLFKEGMENGYLVKRTDGTVWQWDQWQSGMGLVDFTNPAACAWYASKLKALLDMGADCFKTDFGERIPTKDIAYYDNSDPERMHNYYTHLYNKCVFDLLVNERGEGDAVLFARSAIAGGQQFPVHWGGDCYANYESMAESIRGGLSLGLCGFGFWSHDISGFESTATPDLYKRWAAFGLLSSHSRLHGSMSYRVPWLFDEEAVDVLRSFTKLKCRLMPYIYAQAAEGIKRGLPMMRAMLLEFPNDLVAQTSDRQYMFGECLLAAPILNENSAAQYYLPEGKWTNIITNKVIDGGKYIAEQCDYFTMPLLARPNSIIVMGADESKPDYDYTANLTAHVYQMEDGELSAEIYNSDGKKAGCINIHKSGENYSLTTSGTLRDVVLVIH